MPFHAYLGADFLLESKGGPNQDKRGSSKAFPDCGVGQVYSKRNKVNRR